jgi:hypothetical protein
MLSKRRIRVYQAVLDVRLNRVPGHVLITFAINSLRGKNLVNFQHARAHV